MSLALLGPLLALVPLQGSQHALAFDGAGARVVFPIDDLLPGDGSTVADVGAGSFTLELWVRGLSADNPTAHAGGDVELPADAWRAGNVLCDRSTASGGRWYGASVAGGYVRFGTGPGDGSGADAGHTLEGKVDVLDGAWHHVACVRDAATGVKRIFVDAELDAESAPGVSQADLSYPDGDLTPGLPDDDPTLQLGGPKERGAAAPAAFHGLCDELRLWARAASATDVLSWHDRVVLPIQTGLAADWRLEEGSGSVTADRSFAGAPAGLLAGGAAWRSFFAAPADVAPISHGLLPRGFHRERRFDGFVESTSLAALPDGSLLVAERGGTLVRCMDGVATPVLSIATSLASIEHGVVGLALDPAFAANGRFYVHYTSLEPKDRVSRFAWPDWAAGAPVDPAGETVLWENAALGPGHTGGAISVGPDGKLYVPTGDAFFPPGSQDLSHPNGKVLRLELDGSVPSDNPGAGIPGADPAIWAWGLRNPFRSGWDPVTGRFWIADVGGEGPAAWEELHEGVAGANYGWPSLAGPDCLVADCSGMTAPAWGYRHDDPDLAPGQTSASITGGLVYRGGAFPPDYEGSYVFGDYATGWMRRLRFDAAGDVVDAPLFVPAYAAGTIVDLAVDPAGDLWYLTVGLSWASGPDDAALYRVLYTPPDDPTPPSLVVLDTTPSGLDVRLDGFPVRTPFALATRAGYLHRVEAPPAAVDPASGATLAFACWSDGGAAGHGFTAPAGVLNLGAVYGACDAGCGFSTYGHGAGGANVLGLVGGGGGAGPGGTFAVKTTGLAPGAPVWIGVALHAWSFQILGGTVLVDSLAQIATVPLASAGGESVWTTELPAIPALAGIALYLQSLAADARQPFGLAFSNGLELKLCP